MNTEENWDQQIVVGKHFTRRMASPTIAPFNGRFVFKKKKQKTIDRYIFCFLFLLFLKKYLKREKMDEMTHVNHLFFSISLFGHAHSNILRHCSLFPFLFSRQKKNNTTNKKEGKHFKLDFFFRGGCLGRFVLCLNILFWNFSNNLKSSWGGVWIYYENYFYNHYFF